MRAVSFYDLCWSAVTLRSERRLQDLVKWIGRNRCILDAGSYDIRCNDQHIASVYISRDGNVVFDNFVLTNVVK